MGHCTPKLQPSGLQHQSQDSTRQAISSRIETVELQTFSSLEVKPSFTDGETIETVETQRPLRGKGKMLVSLITNEKRALEDLDMGDNATSKSIINSQAHTEKNDRQIKVIASLRKDIELLKEMLRAEKLKTSDL